MFSIQINLNNKKIELFGPEQVGITRHVLKVKLENQPTKHLDVTAKVVESRVELTFPNGGGPLKELSFGSIYFGQKKNITAILVNSSPFISSFAIGVPGHNSDSEGSDTNEKSTIIVSP